MSGKPDVTSLGSHVLYCNSLSHTQSSLYPGFAPEVTMVIQSPLTPITNECTIHQATAPENASKEENAIETELLPALDQEREDTQNFLLLLNIILISFPHIIQ
jgi:hypothetical protein